MRLKETGLNGEVNELIKKLENNEKENEKDNEINETI